MPARQQGDSWLFVGFWFTTDFYKHKELIVSLFDSVYYQATFIIEVIKWLGF
jgi:hypothetical protein